MLQTQPLAPTVLGVSLAPQRNRRVLVGFSYGLLLVAMTALMLLAQRVYEWLQPWTLLLLLLACVSVSATFGRFVTYRLFPEGYVGGAGFQGAARRYLSIGVHWYRREEDGLDEREVAVRNAAYLVAFRWMAIYAALSTILLWSPRPWMGTLTLRLIAVPAFTMAVTLPQAIVLWTEPDVPEEVQV